MSKTYKPKRPKPLKIIDKPLATFRIAKDVSKLSDRQLVRLTKWLNQLSAELSAYPEKFGKFKARLFIYCEKKEGVKQ